MHSGSEIFLIIRFKSNGTATSDGGAQILGNNVWHDSESIATTVAAKSAINKM